MPIISLFNGIYCDAGNIIQHLSDAQGYHIITDQELVEQTAELSGMDTEKIWRTFSSKTSVFNQFTFEKERALAYLKLSLALAVQDDNLVIHGFSGFLLPQSMPHTLRICLTADRASRLDYAQSQHQINENEANAAISADHARSASFTSQLLSIADPLDKSLYDMIISISDTPFDENIQNILKQIDSNDFGADASIKDSARDFLMETRIQTCLIDSGHNVGVLAENGHITLTINRQVLMQERLETELKAITGKVDGVSHVTTRLDTDSPENTQPYRRHNSKMPSRVLLVDDEQEFVKTLSERLQMRDMGAVVAYDGPSALELVHSDDPEVMIVDLKMPGMDGMELIKQVKAFRPEIEIIVLTGHGSEEEKKHAMTLGAFDYMNKPVDINQLSTTLKQAHEKIRAAG